jgi:hypothetical protein
MYITDFNDPDLASRKPEGEYIQRVLVVCPNVDSCLPSPSEVTSRKEGTALLELESIIREQLEANGQGARPLNDKKNKTCNT